MKNLEMKLAEIPLIGIEARTNNRSALDIGELWKKFYVNGIQDRTPNCVDTRIFVLYNHYESDHTGDFNSLIGSPVSDLENIPQGMVGRLIPAQKYCVVRAGGTLPNALIEAWQMIWCSNIKRTFKFDFELYDDRAQDPSNAEIDIFIAVT
jgi:predicted transcriptional regulator YdeE